MMIYILIVHRPPAKIKLKPISPDHMKAWVCRHMRMWRILMFI